MRRAISPLTEGDLDRVMDIEEATQLDPWPLEAFSRCISGLFLSWGVKQEGQLLGYLIADVRGTDHHLVNLAVDRPHQKHGHGRFLLEAFIQFSMTHHADCIHLEVRASNARAIALYESLGFVAVGRRKNYYPAVNSSPMEDAILYTLRRDG